MVYELGGAIRRDCIIFYHDNDSSSLAVNVSISRLGDGVGYYNNHVLDWKNLLVPIDLDSPFNNVKPD